MFTTKTTVHKVKKILKKFLSTHNKQKNDDLSCSNEAAENAINEAIEARLAAMVASAPQSEPWTLKLQVDRLATVSVYTGCQAAGPQIAS